MVNKQENQCPFQTQIIDVILDNMHDVDSNMKENKILRLQSSKEFEMKGLEGTNQIVGMRIMQGIS